MDEEHLNLILVFIETCETLLGHRSSGSVIGLNHLASTANSHHSHSYIAQVLLLALNCANHSLVSHTISGHPPALGGSTTPSNWLREGIGPQEGLTLPGTIRQNLMPWLLNEANPQDAKQCSSDIIKSVLADTFMTENIAKAGGLDAPVEKLGLSAGEKQLFSMARAMCYECVVQGADCADG